MVGVMKKLNETVNRASFFVLSMVSERPQLWHCLIFFLLSSSSMIFIASVHALVAMQISHKLCRHCLRACCAHRTDRVLSMWPRSSLSKVSDFV